MSPHLSVKAVAIRTHVGHYFRRNESVTWLVAIMPGHTWLQRADTDHYLCTPFNIGNFLD